MNHLRGKEPNEDDPESDDLESSTEDKKSKYITTFVIYYCSVALGVTMTFLGPAILHFKTKFDTTTQAISLVYTISIFASLICGLAFGVIFSHVNRHALITFLMALNSILIIVLPYVPSLTLFYIFNALITICCGGFLLSQIVWTIEIWDGNPVFIQGQSFCFSLGMIFPPLIFGPFLPNKNVDHVTLTNSTEYRTDMNFNDSLVLNDEQTEGSIVGRVDIPCAIVGVIGLVAAALLLVILIWLPKSEPPRSKTKGGKMSQVEKSAPGIKRKLNKDFCLKILLVILTAIFAASFIAMETSNGQFLPIFGHMTRVHLSEAKGAQLLFYFTMAFTLGRFLSIVISSFKIRPRIILYGNLLIVLIGNSIIYIWGRDIITWTWIGAMLIGLGASSGAPSVLAHVQGTLKIGNFVGAVIIVMGKSFSVLYALINGTFIDTIPEILMYTNYVSVVVGSLTFVAIFGVMRVMNGRKLGQ